VVTIALPNGLEAVVAAWATWKLGGTAQPLSHRLPARERAEIVELADSALVLGGDELPGRQCLAANYVPDDALSDAPLDPVVSPCWKAMTSGGSTGRPKLIRSTSSSELDPQAAVLFLAREGDVVMAPGPLYHNTPFQLTHTSVLMGCHVVLAEKFDPVQALASIEEHRVSVVSLVPTMMLRMLRVLDERPYDLSSVRVLWHMAAPCAPWLKEAWIDLVGADKVWELYGGTELISITTINGTTWQQRRGSVGAPLFGEMAVFGDDGTELPRGEVGEIFMRPDGAVTFEYVGAEAKMVGDWTTLGDLGWMDAGGFVYLSDRRTDLILAGGQNIYPAEVESALLEHPLVRSAVVVGLPDEDLGQRVHAVVQATGPLSHVQLDEFLADRLIRYKRPRSYRFVSEDLRDDAGKARRSAIREREIDRLADLASTRP
jgi:bile acid-coenzyme A ligase